MNDQTKQTEPTTEQLLTVKEFADAIRVSVSTVRNWIRNGTIQAVKMGRNFKIPASELERIMKNGT